MSSTNGNLQGCTNKSNRHKNRNNNKVQHCYKSTIQPKSLNHFYLFIYLFHSCHFDPPSCLLGLGWGNLWQLQQQFLSRHGQRSHKPERGRFVFLSVICFLIIYFLWTLQEEICVWNEMFFLVLQTSTRIFIRSSFSLDDFFFFFFCKIYKVTHKFLQSSVGICLIKISEIYSKTASMGSGSHTFFMCYGQFCLKIVLSDRKGLTTIFKCYLCWQSTKLARSQPVL